MTVFAVSIRHVYILFQAVHRFASDIIENECCDGSDERSGACPNRCKEIGEAYAQRIAAENKTRKTGAKIRSSYIAFAQREKTRIEKEIVNLNSKISSQEQAVEKLRGLLFGMMILTGP